MSEQQNLFDKREAGRTEQDTTKILSNFEREVIGVIRKNHGVVSSKGQNEIESKIEKYTKEWK